MRVIPSARVRRGRGLAAVLLAGLAILRTPPMEIVGHRGDVFDVGDAGYNFSGDCASYAACIETFYGAIQSAPIVQGATAIEEAWPAGTCDIGSVSLATFGGQSFNFGTQACLVWTNYIEVPLSAILLVVYAVAGVFIILSA